MKHQPLFLLLEAQNFCLAIELAFWLAKPTILYEITQKIDPELPEGLVLLGNALFTLLKMNYPHLVAYICERLSLTFPSFSDSELKTVFSFVAETESKPLSQKLEQALQRFKSLSSFAEKRLFYDLLSQGLTIKKAPSLLPFLSSIQCPTLTPLHIWATLLSGDQAVAKKYLDQIAQAQCIDRNSPYYLLYGCYLALTRGEKAARDHFLSPLEMHYPPTSALLSYYLTNPHQLKTSWLPQAFSWEKVALYKQLTLYFSCLKQEAQALVFEEKMCEEQEASRISLDFI